MDKRFIIRLAEESDKDQVLLLLNNVFEEQERAVSKRDYDFWMWKFQDSPFGKSLLTVVEYQGRIIGVANLWPWEFDFRGNKLKALQPCDSAVHPDFRGKGLFKFTRIQGIDYAQENGYQLIFNFPNENSLPAYKSLGWHYLGRIKWWVKILKPLNVIKGKFIGNKATSYTIDNQYKIDLSILDSITESSKSYDGYIKISRRPQFHKWRYVDRPNRTYGMVHCIKSRKTAAIFTINQKGSSREMVVVDILGASNLNNVRSIFGYLKKAAIHLEVDFIAVMDNPRFQTKILWKQGYFQKKLKNMVVLPIDISLEHTATSFSNWSLMAGLHDSI